MWIIVGEGHITNIAVDPAYRNQGIGKAVLGSLIEEAERRKLTGVTLEVRESNIEAINLYKKFGFICAGIRKDYYHDTKEDAIIMWKYL